MGPFETAGGDEHIYGHAGIPLYRGSATLRAWLYLFNVEPCWWAFTVQVGVLKEWCPARTAGGGVYLSKEEARAACDLFVAGLYLSGAVLELTVGLDLGTSGRGGP